jgi:hypothetical protein
MQTIDLNRDELFILIKKAVREVIQDELGKAWLEGLSTVSDDEQKDIECLYGKPDGQKKIESRETVDL